MSYQRIVNQIEHCISQNENIIFLVGAGISVDSGIPTFRGKDGFWVSGSKNYKAEDFATWYMFEKAPKEVWKWYLYRKAKTHKAAPNAGHTGLVEIEKALKDRFVLVSQNVDGLHRKAGSSEENTYSIHGDMDFVRCSAACTTEKYPFPKEINLENRKDESISDQEWESLHCNKCGSLLRPHVLWFDESYNEVHYRLDSVLDKVDNAGMLFIIGTSGATSLPQHIAYTILNRMGMVVEVNPEISNFTEAILRNPSGGIYIPEGSSEFLTKLAQETNKWI